jgi:hypothetical protein
MIKLERFDCWFDIRNAGFLALSVPPAYAQPVADHLLDWMQRGEL